MIEFRMPNDSPNIARAFQLIERTMVLRDLAAAGIELTPDQQEKWLGCKPAEVNALFAALTAEVEMIGPDGEVLSPAQKGTVQ